MRDDADLSDASLIEATRKGREAAYAELWRRHSSAALAAARAYPAFDADDLAQEAFASVYSAIRRGKGPTSSFRAYLLTSVRNTAIGWHRAQRDEADDTLDTLPDPATEDAEAEAALDRSTSARAFRSLPSRWQEVLWYTEIEGMKPAEVAPLLGLSTRAATQLAFRARDGLREAWVQAHLRSLSDAPECRWTVERLGAHARGNSSARDTAKIKAHLDGCVSCTLVAAEADDVNNRLAFVLLPLVLGVAGAGAYLAHLQTAASGAVAMGAGGAMGMPASVVGAHGSGAAPASGASTASTAGAPASAAAASAPAGVTVLVATVVTLAVATAAVGTVVGLRMAAGTPHTVSAVAGAAPPGVTAPATSAPSSTASPSTAPSAAQAAPAPIQPVSPSAAAVPTLTVPATASPTAPSGPPPSPTATPQPTPTSQPTSTPQPTPTPVPTPTPTPVPTPTGTPTPTPTATPVTGPTIGSVHVSDTGHGMRISFRVTTTPGDTVQVGVGDDMSRQAQVGPNGTVHVVLWPSAAQLQRDDPVTVRATSAAGATTTTSTTLSALIDAANG